MKPRVLLFEVLLALLCSLSFIACENFLDGENVKDELIREIYISNHDCPEATVEEPAFSDAGVAKNKAIIVSFTMPMNPVSFTSSYQITDSIGNNLQPNFMEPQWSNDNTVVTIAANELNLIDLHGKKTLDIYFTLSKNCTSTDGLPINSAVNHKYRINETVDNTPPSMTDNIYVERPVITYMDNEISSSARLIEGSLTSENESQICNTNHINSAMNVYIEGSDYGGGAVKGHIVCRRVSEVTGNKVNEEPKDFIFNLSKLDDSDESGGSFYLDLSSSDYEDGMYEVKLFIQDSSGMDSEDCKTYYVIRDTSLAYCLTSRLVNDTPVFRLETEIPEPTLDDADDDPLYLEWLKRKRLFDIQRPTLRKIKDFRTRILFDKINDDIYYTSELTKNKYSENELTYFVSWGLDKEHLSTPVKIEGKKYTDDTSIATSGDTKYYKLPEAFTSFLNENEASDIILKAIVLDCVGNQNVIYSLWPKTIDFYYYKIESDENNKKKAILNFSNLAVNDTFEDKKIHGKWRVFYAPLGNYNENDDLSDLELKRNGDEYIINNDTPDLLEIKGLELNSKYVVYIQTAYDAESTYNGQYNSTTFGPVKKIIVDTSKTSAGTPPIPEFTIAKIGGEKNSGLYTLKIDIPNYDSKLRYIPYYWDVIKLGYWGENGYIPDEWGWLKLESHTEQSFNITVNNHLRAPLKKIRNEDKPDGVGESNDESLWVCKVWDYTPNKDDNGGPDNTYFKAVENCISEGYPAVPGWIKILAINDTDSSESAMQTFNFYREDDTIPPTVSSEITRHDSHLSFDGHCFEFNDLIREEEGNLTEYFTYYYTPYNSAWADNLNVLSENQIKMLPSGRAPFTGTTWLEPDAQKPTEACYRLDTSIPVFGLEDGEYMYFAKLEDRFGNYTYSTLGKAHIGTFKNKLKVKLDNDGKYFISTLELEPEESFFDRNMINVQVCYDSSWGNYYEWLNELQNCERKTINGKLSLYSYIGDNNDPNIFVYKNGEGVNTEYKTYSLPKDECGNPDKDRILNSGTWYRITMQSFNENTMTAKGSDGVSLKYGRPYTTITACNEAQDGETENYRNLWNRNLWWVDGEQKYDVCTEETVSNTVYYYVPWKNGIDKEDFSDYYASFFSGTATPRSNHSILVNVLVSYRDLGNDPDEWERRGKLVATHRYNDWDENSRSVSCDFNQSVAAEDVSKAREHGLVYYAAVVHFAKGESAVSDVYTMYGF